MGAWAVDAFGNDDAADWCSSLEGAESLAPIEEALGTVLEVGADYLEAPEACTALAAAEVLARLNGQWGERTPYTESADLWVETSGVQATPQAIRNAQAAIDRILGDQSELRELWEESEEYEDWLSSVRDLRARLAAQS